MQEKHGRAQVSACVIIIFVNGCRNEVDLILPRAFMFAPLRNVSMFNSLFVGGALRDDTNYSRFSHDVTKIQTKKLSLLLSFMWYYSTLKPSQKGSSFCDTGLGCIKPF